ncbi:type II secretion system F family protein [Planctomicrobium sp. SH668]|uniref:type II secretion system F family protein n=1 Tax=Planctomicrobium sp. SH668 TaxID=3448126 RepID=UPI003F5B833A
MPDYQYTARQVTGQQVTGVLTATSEREVLATLASQKLFPLKVEISASSKASKKQILRRVPPKYLAVLYSQLGDLLKSGVPLLRALDLLTRQTQHPALKSVLQDVRDQVADGSRLYDAMRQHPKAFNELMISMVRAGEEGGFLEDVLKRIADFTEHQEELKGRVVGAMVYPMFLIGVGGVVVAALLVWFVPRFAPMFDDMAQRGSLPWTTSSLLAISNFCQQYWLIALGIIAAAVYGVMYWLKSPQAKRQLDQIRLRSIGLGPIVRNLALARFTRVLGTLLKNGVPVLNSLRIAKDATGNKVLSEAIDKAADNVSTGKSLARPLAASGQFPEEIVEMIAVGEESNNLENVLIDIAENLDRRTSRQIEMGVRLLEPLLLLMLAAVVLYVVVALLLPIFQISDLT